MNNHDGDSVLYICANIPVTVGIADKNSTVPFDMSFGNVRLPSNYFPCISICVQFITHIYTYEPSICM